MKFSLFFALMTFGIDAFSQTLVQVKYYESPFILDGARFGAGDLFYPMKSTHHESVFLPDTIYYFLPSLDRGYDYSPERHNDCVVSSFDTTLPVFIKKGKALRMLNRTSQGEGDIKLIEFKTVRCNFKILRIADTHFPVVNYEYRRRKDPVFVMRKVKLIYITCPDE